MLSSVSRAISISDTDAITRRVPVSYLRRLASSGLETYMLNSVYYSLGHGTLPDLGNTTRGRYLPMGREIRDGGLVMTRGFSATRPDLHGTLRRSFMRVAPRVYIYLLCFGGNHHLYNGIGLYMLFCLYYLCLSLSDCSASAFLYIDIFEHSISF